ncbi:MAG: OmpA family protein [Desulfobacterales bacterium]|nr:MAG: OmpA family protein [Desulfobacterales bacterium]
MYRTFYNLNSKPFQITTDPKFLWLGEKHKEALAMLKYGILENKGFLLLTGDIGTGKTALVNALVKIIDIAAIVATIPDPGLESLDFFNILAEEFNMNRKFDSKGSFLIHLKHFLHSAYAADKKVLLIIDEAQRLNHELLEQIRLLSNIEMNNRKLINIFFVGQTEFNDMLLQERNKAIRQRITVTYHIEPLSENETWHYIKHRLKIAGTTQEIFQPKAVQEIYSFSQGYPRLINIICDHALLTGYASGVKTIDVNIIKECERELRIPIETKKESSYQPESATKNVIAAPSVSPQEQPFGKKALLLMLCIIALIFGGYFLYNLNIEDSPRWGMDDIAPQKYDSPALREKESFIPGVTTPEKEKKDKSSEIAPAQKTDDASEMQAPPSTADIEQNKTLDKKQGIKPFPDRKMLIYFKHNSNELPNEAFEALDRIAEFMLHNPQTRVNVKGYTDSSGSYNYNISVSQFRANTIKSYLIGKGVNPSHVKALGLGPENPIATNDTEAGRKSNRRVEIELNIDNPE